MRFEEAITADVPLGEVLPTVFEAHRERYAGYTIRRLAQEMHDFYAKREVKDLQKAMFREEHFPAVACTPKVANDEFTRGHVDFVALADAEGRVAAEAALPYPPGIVCVVPGEVWGSTQRDYFLALEEGINLLPGFAPELQGVHLVEGSDGRIQAHGYVLREGGARS